MKQASREWNSQTSFTEEMLERKKKIHARTTTTTTRQKNRRILH